MKRSVVLGSRLVLFAALLVWILGYLSVGVVVFPRFVESLRTYGIPEGILSGFLVFWFWSTVVVASSLLAYKGFLLTGLTWSWYYQNGEEDTK